MTTNQNTDQMKAYYEPARRPRAGTIGRTTIPAGWALSWVESGRFVEGDKIRYATREEAEARIPALLAAHEARRQQQATQQAPIAPAPRAARPVQDCYYCGVPNCDECGTPPAMLAGFGRRFSY